MALRRVDWVVLSGAVFVVVGVALLPTPRDQNPSVPGNAAHQGVTSVRTCVNCHGTEGLQPVPLRHPKRKDCFRCHKEAVTTSWWEPQDSTERSALLNHSESYIQGGYNGVATGVWSCVAGIG